MSIREQRPRKHRKTPANKRLGVQSTDRPAQGERIAKVIARAGLCSRREAETWIAAGRVMLNGETLATPAVTVTEADTVLVDGMPLPAIDRTCVVLFHKPAGLVTTTRDPEGRPTVFSALPKDLPRLVTVGRLDIATEGLLVLTNNGALARALELPANAVTRRYKARVRGRVSQDTLDRLAEGVTIDGVRYRPIDANQIQGTGGANAWIELGLTEGKNREVRRVLDWLGVSVNRLIRTGYGPFGLANLASGKTLEVPDREIDALLKNLGLPADTHLSRDRSVKDDATAVKKPKPRSYKGRRKPDAETNKEKPTSRSKRTGR
ncbi:MAG: pseudouridine synthase [Pseudomonadota bacterium]